jgi:hypothetical protein
LWTLAITLTVNPNPNPNLPAWYEDTKKSCLDYCVVDDFVKEWNNEPSRLGLGLGLVLVLMLAMVKEYILCYVS